MDAFNFYKGRGVMYPVLSALFCLLLMVAGNSLQAQSGSGEGCKVDLPAAVCPGTPVEVFNNLATLPGYASAAIAAQLNSEGTALEVTVSGVTKLPITTDIGEVILHTPDGPQAYRLISDGWTVMVVIDDL